MRDTDYTYAVARVRINELTLLSAADMEQLISAPGFDAAEAILHSKGYTDIEAKMDETRQLIAELLPQNGAGALDFLIIKNDFHNLKAQLKALFSGHEAQGYLMRPAVYDSAAIAQPLQSKRFDQLPACMAVCAETAYDLLATTLDGQLADAVIDRRALETMLALAGGLGNAFAAQLAEKICAFANIKIALRAAHTKKSQDFLEKSLCSCASLSKKDLLAACAQGNIEGFLRETTYRGALDALAQSNAAFEKYCDDALLDFASSAKWKSFGVEPVIAFYLAREAEVKSLRILISCKRIGVPAQEIRKRVRQLYV